MGPTPPVDVFVAPAVELVDVTVAVPALAAARIKVPISDQYLFRTPQFGLNNTMQKRIQRD